MDLYEKTIDTKVIYNGNIITVNIETVLTPNGYTAQREIVKHPGAVAVVPVDEDGHVYFVRQFRKPVESITLEIPAGKIEKGETTEECARRELVEEIGLYPEKLEYITGFFTSPGFSDEVLHLFIARDLKQEKAQTSDGDEFIEVQKIPLAEAVKMAVDGRLKDSKTIIGVLIADRLLKKGNSR